MSLAYRLYLSTVVCVATLLAPLAHADLEVNSRKDVIELTDGTEIVCVVLMVAAKGALIVETDPDDKEKTRQRLIPRDQIAKIKNGKAEGTISGFQTDGELAHKVIQGTGYRQEAKAKTPAKGDVAKGPAPAGPLSLESAKIKKTESDVELAVTKLSPSDLRDAYLARFPELRPMTQGLLGNERATQLIDQAIKGDPLVRKQVEGFLNLVLAGSNQAVPEPAAPAPVRAQKVQKKKKPGAAPADDATPPAADAAK